MYKKIIVPVEIGGIEKGEKILRKAAKLLDNGGEIILLNVIEDIPTYVAVELPGNIVEDAMKEGRDRLNELVAKTGIQATVEVRNGPPANSIIAAAESHGADLVMVASHIPDIYNYFIGATADRVVRHAKCSVLVDR
ncbi:nucleotide-binding universal stress UspA family protein [Rhizobium sp. BK275]|uniref:universal stress protein n=1 Tax=unclassified Rhizobium TaxID=2613769 RepID=UPI001617AD12|nr:MULTISPECIES: universal stress protein [unclassified Rhizobium]MBB3392621.1 nucleotide-binding universal stress UspA family protein [Rhizobium sp. BK275]MBB3408863.1 nucleotide-binding universal stress UspA family protein [Rhizobium sp. BK316]